MERNFRPVQSVVVKSSTNNPFSAKSAAILWLHVKWMVEFHVQFPTHPNQTHQRQFYRSLSISCVWLTIFKIHYMQFIVHCVPLSKFKISAVRDSLLHCNNDWSLLIGRWIASWQVSCQDLRSWDFYSFVDWYFVLRQAVSDTNCDNYWSVTDWLLWECCMCTTRRYRR